MYSIAMATFPPFLQKRSFSNNISTHCLICRKKTIGSTVNQYTTASRE